MKKTIDAKIRRIEELRDEWQDTADLKGVRANYRLAVSLGLQKALDVLKDKNE